MSFLFHWSISWVYLPILPKSLFFVLLVLREVHRLTFTRGQSALRHNLYFDYKHRKKSDSLSNKQQWMDLGTLEVPFDHNHYIHWGFSLPIITQLDYFSRTKERTREHLKDVHFWLRKSFQQKLQNLNPTKKMGCFIVPHKQWCILQNGKLYL